MNRPTRRRSGFGSQTAAAAAAAAAAAVEDSDEEVGDTITLKPRSIGPARASYNPGGSTTSRTSATRSSQISSNANIISHGSHSNNSRHTNIADTRNSGAASNKQDNTASLPRLNTSGLPPPGTGGADADTGAVPGTTASSTSPSPIAPRLVLKMRKDKLREATASWDSRNKIGTARTQASQPKRPTERSRTTSTEVVPAPKPNANLNRNARPGARKVVQSSTEESEEEEEEEDDEEDDEDDEDDDDLSEEEEEEDDDDEDEDAEGEDDEEMADVDAEGESDDGVPMPIPQPPPHPRLPAPRLPHPVPARAKAPPAPPAKAAAKPPPKPAPKFPAKADSTSELDDEDEDEEDEDEDEDEEDDDEDKDAEGETDDEVSIAAPSSVAASTPAFGSRLSTPDMSRLTKRQKSRLDEVYNADLMELPDGFERGVPVNKRPPETAEETALKRAEMARRRKNLTDQRLEEEKMDTINRLLKRQAPKMRGKANSAVSGKAGGDATPAIDGEGQAAAEEDKPELRMVRWVSNKDGVRVYVPGSWIGTPAGSMFEKGMGGRLGHRKMVEVLDEGDVVMAGA